MTPFPNGTGPVNADTAHPLPMPPLVPGAPAPSAAHTGGHAFPGRPSARFTLPALLGLLLLAAPLHAAYGTESAPHPPETWNGKAKRPPPPGAAQPSPSTGNSPSARAAA